MTKATALEPASAARSFDSGFGPPGHPSAWNSVWALFAMTLVRQAGSRRLLLLALLYALPITFAVLIRYNDSGWRGPSSGYEATFAEFLLVFNLIPQALLPMTALVYASGMIQDEIEEQTITYVLIRPLPRWSIYAAKFLATLAVTTGLTAIFTALTYLTIGWGQPDYWEGGGLERMLKTIALFSLTLTTYNALFGFLSLIMKRALLLGVGYILLLEGVVANIDFAIRKVTVVYYFRVMAERWMKIANVWENPGPRMNYNIDFDLAPSLGSSLATLAIASLVLVGLSGLLMATREFRVKTPEGS